MLTYSHKSAKNVANLLPDASYQSPQFFVAIRAQMVNSYFVLFFVAILAVAVWYWCSRMGIEVLFFNQILRFLDSQLLMDLAMYANQS